MNVGTVTLLPVVIFVVPAKEVDLELARSYVDDFGHPDESRVAMVN